MIPTGAKGVAARPTVFSGQPRGLPTLFLTEVWERFSYYGMRALLVLYMTAPATMGGLAFDTAHAARIYGNYTMAVYLLALPGGFIADAMLGARRAIVVGGIMIALGHYALAVPTIATFYLGLMLVALGTGLFKPSISAMVGLLYGQGDRRRDAGFLIFYMGVNVGAFIAPLITGVLAQSIWFKGVLAAAGFDPLLSWHWGFGAAALGMTLAVISFVVRPGALAGLGDPPQVRIDAAAWRALLVIAGTAVLLCLIVLSDQAGFQWLRWMFLVAPLATVGYFVHVGTLRARRLAAVFVFFIASMLFWAIFEQAGLSITLFADRLTHNEVGGFAFPSAWYQALNPLFVIILAPMFAWAWLAMGDRQPSSAVKFVLGLFFLGLSFLLMAPAAALTAAGKVGPWWLVAMFLLQTIGELCLSPVGLSTMTKLAPPGQTGLMLGIWFLSAAWGSKLAGIFGAEFEADAGGDLPWFFLRLALLVLAAALTLAVLVPWLKRLTQGAD
ncbi:MAG: peptide MFS transporter [Hyphomicrobiaceae bacterium]